MPESPILVILDLDETLIHAEAMPDQVGWDFEAGPYKVFIRPGLKDFLQGLREHFEVAIWSSASLDYVTSIVTRIFPEGYPLKFVWARDRCVPARGNFETDIYADLSSHLNFVKPLQKVKKAGFGSMERMLIIDDTPSKSRENYGNAIYPSQFKGDMKDTELSHLLDYLLLIKDEPNMRKIEKRNWRSMILK